jgi:hypothetical protein
MVVQGIEYGLDVGQGHDLAREPTTAIIPGQGQIQVMPVSAGQDAIGDLAGGALASFGSLPKLQGQILGDVRHDEFPS